MKDYRARREQSVTLKEMYFDELIKPVKADGINKYDEM